MKKLVVVVFFVFAHLVALGQTEVDIVQGVFEAVNKLIELEQKEI